MSTNAEPNIIPEVAIPEVKLLPLMLTMSTTQYIQLDAQTPMVELRHFYKPGEFCNIPTLYGRNPRMKTPEQVLAELDEMLKSIE